MMRFCDEPSLHLLLNYQFIPAESCSFPIQLLFQRRLRHQFYSCAAQPRILQGGAPTKQFMPISCDNSVCVLSAIYDRLIKNHFQT